MEKIPLSEDKFTRGIIAGSIAGLLKDIPPLFIDIFHAKIFPTYWDYSGIIAFGKIPDTAIDILIAIIVEIAFSMAVGVVLAYAIDIIKSHHYLIKGAFFGTAVWFFLRALVWIFEIKKFNQPQMPAFFINSVTSAGFGLLIAYINKLLQKVKK